MKKFADFITESRSQQQIATAVQRGQVVYVYGLNSSILGTIPLGANGQFMGFTPATVSVKKGHHVYIFGPTGNQISVVAG